MPTVWMALFIIQFCDNYAYEYAWLKNWLKRPLLLLETDDIRQSYGQILTRMEAFFRIAE